MAMTTDTIKYPYYCFHEDNWGQKLEARYWNPNNQNICIIASILKMKLCSMWLNKEPS